MPGLPGMKRQWIGCFINGNISRVLISGRIQTGSYTDRDGRKVYTTQVIIEEQEFADSKGAGGEKGQKSQQANVDADGFMNIPDGVEDEGLPFN